MQEKYSRCCYVDVIYLYVVVERAKFNAEDAEDDEDDDDDEMMMMMMMMMVMMMMMNDCESCTKSLKTLHMGTSKCVVDNIFWILHPRKTNIEPENHRFEKENHLPNLHF